MNSLSKDLLEKILINFPVKSLMRLACVCKSWYVLIKSNTSFIHKHLNDHKREQMLLVTCYVYGENIKFKFLSNELTTIVDRYSNFSISKCAQINGPPCNGIFCFYEPEEGKGVLWNPANRESRTLPLFPRDYTPGYHYKWSGPQLGWDRRINDHKLVVFSTRFDKDGEACGDGVAIYSMNNDSWRRFEGIVPFYPSIFDPYDQSQIGLDGLLYWFQFQHGNYRLLSFHPSDEVFEEITRPDFLLEPDILCTILTTYNDRIAIICSEFSFHEQCFETWVLSDSCWNKVLTIGPFTPNVRALGFWKHEDQLFLLKQSLVEFPAECLVIYDRQTQQLNELEEEFPGVFLQIHPYKESLVSLKNSLFI